MDESFPPTGAASPGEAFRSAPLPPPPGADTADADVPAVQPPANSPALPQPGFWLSLGITVLLVVLQGIVGIAAVVVLMVVSMAMTGHEPDDAQIAIVLLPVGVMEMIVTAVAAAVIFFGQNARRVLAVRGVAWPHLLVILLATPPFLVVAQEIAALSTEYLPTFSDEMFEDFASLPVAFVLLFGGLGPALGEEIIFRGILGRGLVARYGMWVGGALAALFFGVVHVDPAQAISVLWLGWILQGVYVATRSLSAPIFMHLLNNSLAFLQLKYYDPFADREHLPAVLIVAAMLALVGLGVVMYQVRSRWILPDGTAWSPGYVTAEMPPASLEARCQWQRPQVAVAAVGVLTYLIFWVTFASAL